MESSDKALTVQTPTEVRQEQFALLVVFGDEDGKGLSVSAAGRRLDLTPHTASVWWRTKYVQDLVREYLDVMRRDTQLKALKLREKAFRTLEKAMDSPAYTPTQRAAAKDIISLGLGTEVAASDNRVGLQVVVNTGLPADAIARQTRRHAKHQDDDVVEGVFTPVE